MKNDLWLFFLLALLASVACAGDGGPEAPSAEGEEDELLTTSVLTVSSPAFGEGETIPERYTCDGEDAPPPLAWRESPPGVESFALIVDDPDAPSGTWVHWILYNIPPEARELGSGATGVPGANSWDRNDYGGPCPPRGTEHRYVFTLFALDTMLALEPGADKERVTDAIDGHILAQGQLVGLYGR